MFKKSFTYAESLVVLLIIGFLTILLINIFSANTRTKETTTKLHKFYTLMNEVVDRAETKLEYEVKDWNFGIDTPLAFFNSYFSDYIRYKSISGDSTVYLDDGSSFQMDKKPEYLQFIYDINGHNKGANELGVDRFVFMLYKDENHHKPNKFNVFRNDITNRSTVRSNCVNTSRYYCSNLIKLDGWQIKSDYPYSI